MNKNIIKFGLPIIIAVLYIFTDIFINGANDATIKFGKILTILPFWTIGLVVFLIAGFIVRKKTKDSYMLHSFIMSLGMMFIVFLSFLFVSNYKNKKEQEYYSPKQTQIRFDKNIKSIDSLSIIIQNKPNNYKAVNKRGILYYKTKQFVLAVSDLEKAIKNNSANNETFENIARIYSRNKEFEKSDSICDIALKTNLTNDEKSLFHLLKEQNRIAIKYGN